MKKREQEEAFLELKMMEIGTLGPSLVFATRGADGVLYKSKRCAKRHGVITKSDARRATLIEGLLFRNASVSSDLEIHLPNVDARRRCDGCAMDWKWNWYCHCPGAIASRHWEHVSH